ncbi:Sas10/Utp3/C1D family-domain-containing protein [Xylogone sp. PMI_703]|nr:Sas10/Utp3/C1D family-domain-containing protein [Xylogone sp. PMI_703]
MDTTELIAQIEQLDDELDNLEDVLQPILRNPLWEKASKLPVMDRAKLYVLVTYAIESLLFSYLRLNGVKAREHPVFKELTRVKEYFSKIAAAETPVAQKGNLKLDKQAASRFIASGLAGNDKIDLQRAEQQAKERARSHIKFQELSKKRKAEDTGAEGHAALSPTIDSSSDLQPDTNSDHKGPKDEIKRPEERARSRKKRTKNSKQANSG